MKKILISLFIGIVFLLPQVAFGKSVSGNGSVIVEYLHPIDASGSNCISSNTLNDGDPITWDVGAEYIVNAYDNSTNQIVNENATVPQGTQIRFDVVLENSQTSWFENGRSYDSPNGIWVDSFPAPVAGCLLDLPGRPPSQNVYFKRPTTNFNHSGSSASMSCNGNGSLCTVTGAGTLATSIDFSPGSFVAHGSGVYMADPVAPAYWHPISGIGFPVTPVLTYPIQVAGPTNQPPSAPSLTGPTTGSTSVSYPYNTQASDPDGDTVRYGIDWDNNNTVDEWTTYVASNTSVSTNHSWATAGSYTFKALAQDSNGASSGWSTPLTMTIQNIVNGTCGAANAFPTTNPPSIGLCFSGTNTPVTPGVAPGPYSWSCTGGGGGSTATCSAPYLEPAPVVDLKINGSDGPLTVNRNANLNITWGNIPYAATCTGTGNNWTGGKFTTGGNDNIQATAASLYTLTCTNSQGISASDSISVTLAPTLKICQNSCSGSIEPPASFSMDRYDTKDLVACHNDAVSCTDATGDVTTSATWTEGGGNPVSLGGSSPKTLTADNVGTESIQATYSGNTVIRSVTVTCTDSGACQRDSRSQSLCQKDNFTVTDNCGQIQNCTGEKTCDYNWKEVAP